MTTGNFGGFEVWLEEKESSLFELDCNHGSLKHPLKDIGINGLVLDAGGLKRQITVFRLPEESPCRNLKQSIPVQLDGEGDNPLWVCVTTEDGFQAWSSPIYLFG